MPEERTGLKWNPGRGIGRFRFPCLFVMKKGVQKMSGFYGNGIALTEKVLDYLWGRQNITLNNIAVSYTHLNYVGAFRQVRDLGAINIGIYDPNTCLLYTSRCV